MAPSSVRRWSALAGAALALALAVPGFGQESPAPPEARIAQLESTLHGVRGEVRRQRKVLDGLQAELRRRDRDSTDTGNELRVLRERLEAERSGWLIAVAACGALSLVALLLAARRPPDPTDRLLDERIRLAEARLRALQEPPAGR